MNADELFRAALDRRSLTYTISDEGLYLVQIGDISATINLDNVRRNYERDNDADAIERFAQQLDGDIFEDQPSWEDVTPFLRYSLEPSDYATGFDDTVVERQLFFRCGDSQNSGQSGKIRVIQERL